MQLSLSFTTTFVIATALIFGGKSDAAFNLDWIDNWFRSSRSLPVESSQAQSVQVVAAAASESSLAASVTNEPHSFCPKESSVLLAPFCTCDGPVNFPIIKCNRIPSVTSLRRLLGIRFPIGSFGKLYISNSSLLTLDKIPNLTAELTFTAITFTKTNTKSVDLNVFESSRFTLKRLEVTHNHLDTFPFQNLTRFKKLTHLDLYYNNIKTIPDDAFGHNDHIQAIDLSYNKISYVGSNSFYELAALELLDLSHNKLKVINNNAFALRTSNRRLIIDLSYNKIFYLAENCFKGQSPRELILDYNSMAKLPEKHFKPILNAQVTQTEGTISVKGKAFFHLTLT